MDTSQQYPVVKITRKTTVSPRKPIEIIDDPTYAEKPPPECITLQNQGTFKGPTASIRYGFYKGELYINARQLAIAAKDISVRASTDRGSYYKSTI